MRSVVVYRPWLVLAGLALLGCSTPHDLPDVDAFERTGSVVFQSVDIHREACCVEIVSAQNPGARWGGISMVGVVALLFIVMVGLTVTAREKRDWLALTVVMGLFLSAVVWYAADKMWVDRFSTIDLEARTLTLRAERLWGASEHTEALDGLEVSLWYMGSEPKGRGLTHIFRIGDHTVLVAYGQVGDDVREFEALRDAFAASIGLPSSPTRTHHYLGW
ncbi:MAG: hypothetical protein ACI8S6_001644 [Myxococcota bacterium]